MTKSINSTFALLDVKADRHAFAKRIEGGERVPVVITGTIIDQWGEDDGTSIEFEVDVTSVTEGEPAVSGATLNTETALTLVAKIEAFDRDCEANEHTDTDDAWSLLHQIADRLRDTLDAGQLAELVEEGNRHRAEIAADVALGEREVDGVYKEDGKWFFDPDTTGNDPHAILLGPFETREQAMEAAHSATNVAAAA